MNNKEIITKLLNMGKIPNNEDLSSEQFKEYDHLMSMLEVPLSFEEAEQLITLFSDNCDDLNWGLLHIIENVPYSDVERYKKLISKCSNEEYREIFEIRLNNWLADR